MLARPYRIRSMHRHARREVARQQAIGRPQLRFDEVLIPLAKPMLTNAE